MMLAKRKLSRLLIAGVMAAGGLGSAVLALGPSSAAHAEPTFPHSYAGVGSDTIQDVFDAYTGAEPFPGQRNAGGLNLVPTPYTPLLANAAPATGTGCSIPGGFGTCGSYSGISSWDALLPDAVDANHPGTITTKLGGPTFDRPNGSGDGSLILQDILSNTLWKATGTHVSIAGPKSVTGQVDFARSSSGPDTTKPGTNLTFVPFARDAVSYAYYDHATNEIGGAASLNVSQLQTLYGQGSTGSITLPNGHKVKACFGNTASGTMKFFVKAVGGTVTTTTADAAAALNGCSGLEENGGDVFYSKVSATPFTATDDAVIPFSVGSWISQANLVANDRSGVARSHSVDLGNIGGLSVAPDSTAKPYNGTAPSETPSASYYASSFGRNVWVIVPTNLIQCNSVVCNQDQDLSELFTTQGANSFGAAGTTGDFNGYGFTAIICQGPAQATANKFGFSSTLPSGTTCGQTTTTANA